MFCWTPLLVRLPVGVRLQKRSNNRSVLQRREAFTVQGRPGHQLQPWWSHRLRRWLYLESLGTTPTPSQEKLLSAVPCAFRQGRAGQDWSSPHAHDTGATCQSREEVQICQAGGAYVQDRLGQADWSDFEEDWAEGYGLAQLNHSEARKPSLLIYFRSKQSFVGFF